MTRQSFGRALGFAALAAAFTFPVLVVAASYGSGGYYRHDASLAAYLLALVPLRTFSAAKDARSGVRAGVVTAALSLLLVLVIDSVQAALLAALVNLAIGRALLGASRELGRWLFIELLLSALSFAAFSAFYDQQWIGDAMAVWAFWLVQSVYSLLAQTSGQGEEQHVDKFVAAQVAAERLLQP